MAGVKGRTGSPGNQSNFKHGLSAIQKRGGRHHRARGEHQAEQNRMAKRTEDFDSPARGPKSIMSHLRRFSYHQDRIDRRVRHILQDLFEGEIGSI